MKALPEHLQTQQNKHKINASINKLASAKASVSKIIEQKYLDLFDLITEHLKAKLESQQILLCSKIEGAILIEGTKI